MKNHSKINKLLHSQPYGTIFTSGWMLRNGYSHALQQRYKESGWLVPIGNGASKRFGDEVSVEGALYTLQKQMELSVHIGGKSALAIMGRSHYLQMGKSRLVLFSRADEKLPKWFAEYDWEVTIDYNSSNFLEDEIGMVESNIQNFKVRISGEIRALLECLYLSSRDQNIMECYEILEGMSNLRPQLVQKLLEGCNSVKVKRLFLFMAEKAGHAWVKYLKQDCLDLGSGKRSIVPNGAYVKKYQITVPKELMKNGESI